MRLSRRERALVGGAVVTWLAAAACAGGDHIVGFLPSEADAAAANNDASLATDTPSFGDVGAGDAGGYPNCSGDLHSVLGPDGNVVEACPPDQGCANGVCVPACQAAAASKGSVGCDFFVSTPGFAFGILPPCLAAFLANNWGAEAAVQISRGGSSLDVTTFGRVPDGTPAVANWPAVSATGVPANDVAVFFLSSDPTSANPQTDAGTPLNCPSIDAVDAGTAVVDTTYGPREAIYTSGRGQSFHIVTSVPVSLYDILPFGGARSWLPSAQLVLPSTAWGTNFISISPKECVGGSCVSTGGLEWLQVLGMQDNTAVSVKPVQPLPASRSGDVVMAPSGAVTTYTVNAGEFVQWGYNADLSGTLFSSDKPVAVVSGAFLCLNGATSPSGGGCDSAHQSMLPISALGFEYVAQPYATRRASLQPESIPYRVVGTKDGTTLTYDPPSIGGPTSLQTGQVADFEANTAFTLKSQDNDHVFYVMQHMTGCLVTDGPRPGITPGADKLIGNSQVCLGDEEFVDVLPSAQWLPKYVFFTDPSYGTTNVTIARRASPQGGFHDVKIDCTGVVTGWQDVGSGGTYQAANVDLVRAATGVGPCKNGGHVAESDVPFGLVVWGLDEFASYAYPAGGNIATINTVVVPVK
jgi:hypothetical protein